jgi:hypothetical protein
MMKWNERLQTTLTQLLVEERPRSSVGGRRRGRVIVGSSVTSEGVATAWVAMDLHVRIAGERFLDPSLRIFGNEFILLAKMHQHRNRNRASFSEMILRAAAVVRDCSVRVAPMTPTLPEAWLRVRAAARVSTMSDTPESTL